MMRYRRMKLRRASTPEPPPWLMASTGRPSRRSPAVSRWLLPGHTWQEQQLNVYYVAAIWLGMALLASMVSIWIAVPAALVEIVIGALAGNIPGIRSTSPRPASSPSWPASARSC